MKINFENANFETSFGRLDQFNDQDVIFEVAFAGKSNVGKSSLLNRLMKKKRLAKVSSTPGKTATINFYDIDEKIRFVDFPGYGYARISKIQKEKWGELISGYLVLDRNLVLTVLLLDSRHPPTKDDLLMLDFLVESEIPTIIAFTKSDKLSKKQLGERMEDFNEMIFDEYDIFHIFTSSESGLGIDELKETITDAVTLNEEGNHEDEE